MMAEQSSGPQVPHDAKYRPGKAFGSGRTNTGNIAGSTNKVVASHNKDVLKGRPMLRK